MDRNQGTFNVRMGLTREGVAQIEEIGKLLFQAIALIREKGLDQWRFDEQSRLAEMSFRFAQERDPGRLAQSLASRLQLYPPKLVLSAPYKMTTYRPRRIRELLGYLRPDNVNIQVVSPGLETENVTENYEVAYSLSRIGDDLVETWQNPGPATQLALPQPNPFIPVRLAMLDNPAMTPVPVQLDNEDGIELWYQQDSEFGLPRANFYFNVMSPATTVSARSLVLTELYVRMVNSQLNHTVYPAYLADLNYNLYRHGRGYSVRISGFEDQQTALITLVVDALKKPQFDLEIFQIVRDRYARELKNVARDSPSSQAIHEIYRLVMVPYWSEGEKLDVLEKVTTEDLQQFHSEFYRNVDVVALSHGDVSADSTRARLDIVARLFTGSAMGVEVSRADIRNLDGDAVYLRTMEIDHSDAALAVYFQASDNSREQRAKVALLKSLLESPFYNHLRTVNRVGYLVNAGTIVVNQHPGLFFAVQSPSHSPQQLHQLYSEFFDDFSGQLDQMPLQQFEGIRSGLVDRVLRKSQKLGDRSSRYWHEIDLEELDFDSSQKFAHVLEALSLEDMQKFYRQLIVKNGGEIIVQSTGTSLEGAIPGDDYQQTGDVIQFRNRFLVQ
jgi:secreted Zn-dependent insulinase-like peptidase